MKKSIFLIIAVISFLHFINAQSSQWMNYTNGDGINALAEEDNNMWIGTWGGLVQLDKTTGNPNFYNKANSGLPTNLLGSIAIDDNGTKWIGIRNYIGGGLAAFDGTNWTAYNISNSGLPDNNVRSIAIDTNGTKWIGTYWDGLAAYNEGGIPLWVSEKTTTDPLVEVFPNPFTTSTTIEYQIEQPTQVILTIFNSFGEQIELIQQHQQSGKHQITWHPDKLQAGVYFCVLKTNEGRKTSKLIKL